jgi:hypothetical protein
MIPLRIERRPDAIQYVLSRRAARLLVCPSNMPGEVRENDSPSTWIAPEPRRKRHVLRPSGCPYPHQFSRGRVALRRSWNRQFARPCCGISHATSLSRPGEADQKPEITSSGQRCQICSEETGESFGKALRKLSSLKRKQ